MTREKRRRCRNCPDTKDGLPPPEPMVAVASPTTRPDAEKLWQFGLYSCSTVLELLFGYVAMDMPGDPLPKLKRLHARLGEIIQTREERTRANNGPAN